MVLIQRTGWPAIFFAAKNGRVNILKKMLEKGAKTELEVGQSDHAPPVAMFVLIFFSVYQTGLKLVDVASFFKRKAIIDEISKKSQTQPTHTPPQPTPSLPHEVYSCCSHPLEPLLLTLLLVQVPGIEPVSIGIELTSFTKKDSAIDESSQQESATRPVSEESSDHKSGPPVDADQGEEMQEVTIG